MLFNGVPPGDLLYLFLIIFSILLVIFLLISGGLYYIKNMRITKGKAASLVFFGLLGILIISLPASYHIGRLLWYLDIINAVIIVEIIITIMAFAIFIYLIESKKKILKEAGVEYSNYRPKTIIPKEKDWKSIAGRIGPLLTLIVGIFFVIDGVLGFLFLSFNTLICGIIAILAIYYGYKGMNNARFICFVSGIIAVIGLVLPPPLNFSINIFVIMFWGTQFLYYDYLIIFLLILGGVLSIVSGERFLNYYMEIKIQNRLNL